MQKILIAQELKPLLTYRREYLDRGDITIFTAATNDELLKIHIEENVNIIVTKRDLPGASSETIFNIIRQGKQLKDALVIMACEDDVFLRERCGRWGAHAVLTMPVDPALLHSKVREFLNVAPRQSYRVVLNVTLEGKFKNRQFLCHTENLSATGVLIRTGQILSQGDIIACSLFLPNGTKIRANGEVARVIAQNPGAKENLYGIRYTDLAGDIRSAIELFVDKEKQYVNVSVSQKRSDLVA